jgi:hypothetical protein
MVNSKNHIIELNAYINVNRVQPKALAVRNSTFISQFESGLGRQAGRIWAMV